MKKKVLGLALITLGIQPAVYADQGDSLYYSIYASYNEGDGDVIAKGSNIAVDADFPTGYEAGDGAGLGFGVGYYLNDNLRLEANLSYRSSDADDTRIGAGARNGFDYSVQLDSEIYNLGVDVIYDFNSQSKFQPYVKAGIGAAYNKTSGSIGSSNDPFFPQVLGPGGFLNDSGRYPYEEESDTNFSYNIGAGLTYQINNNLSLFTQYQYLNVGDIATQADEFTDAFAIDDYAMHEFSIGLRF